MHDRHSNEHKRNGKHVTYLRDDVVLLWILRDAVVLESKRIFSFKVNPVPKCVIQPNTVMK
jgi:hypothetical protein